MCQEAQRTETDRPAILITRAGEILRPYLEDLDALLICFTHLELVKGDARGAAEATLGELQAPPQSHLPDM